MRANSRRRRRTCRANVEVYPSQISHNQGTHLNITVAYGGTAKEAGLDGNVIQPTKLQELALMKQVRGWRCLEY